MEAKSTSTAMKKAREEVQEVNLIRAERVERDQVKQEICTIQGWGRFIWSRARTGVRKGKDVGRVGGEVLLKKRKGWWGKAHIYMSSFK